MNKVVLKILSVLYPFYPLLAWGLHFGTDKPLDFIVNIALLPIAFFYLFSSKKKLPAYLVFFIIFTIFHLISAFSNNAIPLDTNKVYFIFQDGNFLACTLFIIIENTEFDEKFMDRLTRNIFIMVVLTLIVSVYQIKDPTFMFNTNLLKGDELEFWGDDVRNNAFYSYISTNSIGFTFPFMIAILLNFYSSKQIHFPIIIMTGIIVAFLTKSRYVMISTFIAISQLFFASGRSVGNKMSMVVVFVACIYGAIFIAEQSGFNINKVVEERILEKDTDLGSAKSRVLSYEVFLIKYPENPWLGVGPKTRPDVVALLQNETPVIHVGYLCYLYYYGAIGCFFLFGTIYFLLRRAWKVGKQHGFWGALFGMVAFSFANTTLVYFVFSEMGVILGVIYMRYYLSSEELPDAETEIQAIQHA